jgi:hypothetical protein
MGFATFWPLCFLLPYIYYRCIGTVHGFVSLYIACMRCCGTTVRAINFSCLPLFKGPVALECWYVSFDLPVIFTRIPIT